MNEFAPCPKCGSANAERVRYTWWGGFIGPKLLNHVKCANCGTSYHGKSGKSNTLTITIYMIAVFVIALLAFSLIRTF